jgi:hypothetical protein
MICCELVIWVVFMQRCVAQLHIFAEAELLQPLLRKFEHAHISLSQRRSRRVHVFGV